ncbi:hypothetical protein A3C96_00335 [Candidatus Uhrbacteria bacterium RIFCSPHIGHO2_02_FULL_60_10]|uniref:SprT-like domain-containing protein n=1 Tax=Candidatus Uhrbacteria bacterium RIFCSPHIGHO2_02_FULL_60_10 TaxID=1802392 RepID=A0A1F7U7G5_9BACT|nr:MAG: hypothetical protein A3C96_00335 [Candidatus Uhrbacteria bacterium RIFCSPHIGHO2_02_FULL_60_10]
MSENSRRFERRYARDQANECLRFLSRRTWRVVYIDMFNRPKSCRPYDLSPGAVGTCDYEEKTLFIDYRHDVMSTLIHELIHARYPNKTEKEVGRLEKLIMRYLTPGQAVQLHLAMSAVLDTPDEQDE